MMRFGLIVLCFLSMCCAPVREGMGKRERLVNAIIQWESRNTDDATGDHGNALGCLQIHRVMVDDVNRILGKSKYTYDDRLSRVKSIEMFWVYSDHYSKGCSDEVIARRWNGGPEGDKKKATLAYWKNVKRYL